MSDENDWFGPDAATFGDRLAGAREAAGMTQADLARRIGVKKTTIAAWENDLSEPRANRLSMMAGLLNVSIMWLLTGEGEGPDGPDATESAVDLAAITRDLRALQAQLRQASERTARLEKQLRAMQRDETV